ncbi:PadR family transcriptional regulator [Gulosibacter sp. 10]|uniref:PadR family transcriptional regulator n=1 Tax=Gulosibacter sp. 10 TaxID=1255570 RepID=UPI00097EA004|nr:PadR family transcriptional regulator [Gulosibacter sp. 10]SJM64289.1 Transcriptional regulator, PadR family [Gulosibacter sp. 10]
MTPPVFGHGELRLVILTLIAQEPRHGYELITALNEHFDGDYSPSAGTIYPRLSKLQEEGLVTKDQLGRKTIYTITEAGRAEVESRREEFERITSERTDTVRSLADTAREGLAQARRGLRTELDEIAKKARRAAEDAVRTANGRPAGDGSAEEAPADPSTPTAPEHEPGAADAPPADAPRTKADQSDLLRRVDVALQQFRMEVRQDARECAQLRALDEDTVAELETQLRETRRRFGALLRVHR